MRSGGNGTSCFTITLPSSDWGPLFFAKTLSALFAVREMTP
jgi:hypothetical protein